MIVTKPPRSTNTRRFYLATKCQYLGWINQAFGEIFEDLDHYKQEKHFKQCLSKLTLEDVKSAIKRADFIMLYNAKDRKYSFSTKDTSTIGTIRHCLFMRL